MKTFENLEFKKHPISSGVIAYMGFNNGYGVSVIKTEHSYGGDRGLYELAVIKDNKICYDTHITDDVIGYLDECEVSEKMIMVQELL